MQHTEVEGSVARDASGGHLQSDQLLKAGSLGVFGIVFLVVVTASPLSGTIGITPVAIGLGNGVGAPGAFLAGAIVLMLFAVGYVAMSREITNAGAFFAYVTAGFGPRVGTAAGFVAVLAYNILTVYLVGFLGYFANSVFIAELSIDIPWWVFGLGSLALALALATRGMELSVRVLMVILAVETLLLGALIVAVPINEGFGAFPMESFSPSEVFSSGAGVGLMIGFLAYIGFEGTAIFSEEAKDSHRTIPRATYIAIAVLALFYVLGAWALIAAYGADAAPGIAAKDPGNLTLNAAGAQLGDWARHTFSWVLLIGSFAILCALHNMSSRYLLAFGREGLLPSALGRTHPRLKTPIAASVTQASFTAIVVLVYVIAGADPYLDLISTLAAVATVGIVALQALTAAAVVGFFWRRADRHWWKTVLAPGLACAGLTAGCVLILDNYAVLTGSSSAFVNGLPWGLVIAAVVGFVVGWVRPLHRPIDVFGEYESWPRAEPAPVETA